jgi:hypothetical protein
MYFLYNVRSIIIIKEYYILKNNKYINLTTNVDIFFQSLLQLSHNRIANVDYLSRNQITNVDIFFPSCVFILDD